MKVPARGKMGLVGNNRCGKEGIAEVLTKITEPTQGGVFIDGRNLLEYSVKRMRSQVYHVTKEPVIFNASIKENISLGRS